MKFIFIVLFSFYTLICIGYILLQSNLILAESDYFIVPQRFDGNVREGNLKYISDNYKKGPEGNLKASVITLYKMVKYLEAKEVLIGMKKSKVIEMLGEGGENYSGSQDGGYADPSTYMLYNPGSPDGYLGTYPPYCFAVYFDNDIVVHTEIFREEYCIAPKLENNNESRINRYFIKN